jgi:hypothetical protein
LGKVAWRENESTTESVEKTHPERDHKSEAQSLVWWFALQGAERHAKFVAGAADAEYRDCSCCGAQRRAESLASKFTAGRGPRTDA